MFFSTIGAIITVIYLFLRMEKYNIDYKSLIIYAFFALIFLFVGSRLVFIISMIPAMIKEFSFDKLVRYILNGGIVFYGGMLGSILGIFIYSFIRKDDRRKVYNYFSPAIPLFHIFGRIGCFFGGCCYGIECSWGFSMAETPDIIRFPVQIAESICNLIIFIVMNILEKKKGTNINLLMVYLYAYSVCRFVLEFFRGDIIRGLWGFLSTSQIISILILFMCTVYCLIKKRKEKQLNNEKSL